MNSVKIINTTPETVPNYGFCGYKSLKQEGYSHKLDWLKHRFAEGMKFKVLQPDSGGVVGFIEYIPGEYAWRAINAEGYMVIHCIAIFYRQHREQGYGRLLIEESIADARKGKMSGVAVVTRKGTWMVGKELFLRNGFEVVDTARPDFELLALKFSDAPSPSFPKDWDQRLSRYGIGLTIIQSDQCPYTAKAINEISATAEEEYSIKPKIIELKTGKDAQNAPSPFAIFGIVYNGKLVADHPISNTRFKNIMNKETR